MKIKAILLLCLIVIISVGCSGNLYNTAKENVPSEPITVNVEPSIQDEVPVKEEVKVVEPVKEEEPIVTEVVPVVEELVDNSADEKIAAMFVNQFTSEKPFNLNLITSDLNNENTSWTFKRNTDHSPVTGYYTADLKLYGAHFIGDTSEKVVYLTFDEGYENGFTPTILDVLEENNVRATFFITGDYIDKSGDLVKRMVNEGHLVGNHSENHPEFPLLDDEGVYKEVTSLSNKYEALIGKEMDPFFRPPSGKYNERILYLTRKLGYHTIFWSMAHKDWLTAEQPGMEAAHKHVMDNYHNGAIILLHAVSESNTQALDSIIKDLKALGYRFGSLYELE